MKTFTLPNFNLMTDTDFKSWLTSLDTPTVLQNLTDITEVITERFGSDARVTTSSFHSPRIVRVVEHAV